MIVLYVLFQTAKILTPASHPPYSYPRTRVKNNLNPQTKNPLILLLLLLLLARRRKSPQQYPTLLLLQRNLLIISKTKTSRTPFFPPPLTYGARTGALVGCVGFFFCVLRGTRPGCSGRIGFGCWGEYLLFYFYFFFLSINATYS